MAEITLTKKQTEYLPVMLWLFEGPRCSGRTFLMAYAFVLTATKHGQWVTVWDHHDSSEQTRRIMVAQIHDIIFQINKGRPQEEKLVLQHEGSRIRIIGAYHGFEEGGESGVEQPDDNPYLPKWNDKRG